MLKKPRHQHPSLVRVRWARELVVGQGVLEPLDQRFPGHSEEEQTAIS